MLKLKYLLMLLTVVVLVACGGGAVGGSGGSGVDPVVQTPNYTQLASTAALASAVDLANNTVSINQSCSVVARAGQTALNQNHIEAH
jgi:hypothetical protein